MKKFPKTIYIQWEGDGDGEFFLLSHENIKDLEDDKVAIYTLKEIKKKTTEARLESITTNEKEDKPKGLIGRVIHYYGKAMVVIVRLEKDIRVGDAILLRKPNTDAVYAQEIKSMEFEHEQIKFAKKGSEVAIKVDVVAKSGVEIYNTK